MCEEEKKKYEREKRERDFSLYLSPLFFFFSFFMCSVTRNLSRIMSPAIEKKNCNNVSHHSFFRYLCSLRRFKGRKGRIMDENKTLKVELVKGRAVKKKIKKKKGMKK